MCSFARLGDQSLICTFADRPSQSAVPSTTKRNMKAFGSRTNIPAAAMWFEKQFPPFIDFDQDSKCLLSFFQSRLLS